jgi:hypothetical protein
VNDNRESISALEIEDRQRNGDGTPHQLSAAQDYWCGEGSQLSTGEPSSGTGCEACDQETRTWNPQFMSMTYALSRLNWIKNLEHV